MSTTDALKAKVAPTAARNQAVAATRKPNTVLAMVLDKKFQDQMRLALPKAMTADRLTRIVMTECRKEPKLLKCDPASFMAVVLQCAQLGLEPGSALGHCYMLPFGNGKSESGLPNAQLIIGYRGMIELARRSGQVVSLSAYAVHEGDDFHYELGLKPDIKHVPSSAADRGPLTYVYAVAQLKGGGFAFDVMSRAEVEAIRSTSKAGSRGPWVDHFEEMAKKTVVRRLFKYLPVSVEAARAVEVDEKADRGEAVTSIDVLEGEYIDKGGEMPEIPEVPEVPEVVEPGAE